jgi:hypothetical protein
MMDPIIDPMRGCDQRLCLRRAFFLIDEFLQMGAEHGVDFVLEHHQVGIAVDPSYPPRPMTTMRRSMRAG